MAKATGKRLPQSHSVQLHALCLAANQLDASNKLLFLVGLLSEVFLLTMENVYHEQPLDT
jgi:hypothetical protein